MKNGYAGHEFSGDPVGPDDATLPLPGRLLLVQNPSSWVSIPSPSEPQLEDTYSSCPRVPRAQQDTYSSCPRVPSAQERQFADLLNSDTQPSVPFAQQLDTQHAQVSKTPVPIANGTASNGVIQASVAVGVPTLTYCVQNIPARYTQDQLLNQWPPDGSYDFIYLPYSEKQKRAARYAFINFTSPEAATAFIAQLDGRCLGDARSTELVMIRTAKVQGLRANIEQFLVSSRRPPKWEPAVFYGAQRVNFQQATRDLGLPPAQYASSASRSIVESWGQSSSSAAAASAKSREAACEDGAFKLFSL